MPGLERAARDIDAFTRAEARRVWSFRTRLTPAGQEAFDIRPVGLRLQLTELYFDVMAIEIAPYFAPIDRLSARLGRCASGAAAAVR